MTRIYTKTGDDGETGLFGGGRVPKNDARVDAYGEVDELNASLGLARSLGLGPDLDGVVKSLQDQLFTVGAVLATPRESKADAHIPHVRPEWAAAMESWIDGFEAKLPPLQSFVLPGGSAGAKDENPLKNPMKGLDKTGDGTLAGALALAGALGAASTAGAVALAGRGRKER